MTKQEILEAAIELFNETNSREGGIGLEWREVIENNPWILKEIITSMGSNYLGSTFLMFLEIGYNLAKVETAQSTENLKVC